jgi:hypothetical protein
MVRKLFAVSHQLSAIGCQIVACIPGCRVLSAPVVTESSFALTVVEVVAPASCRLSRGRLALGGTLFADS